MSFWKEKTLDEMTSEEWESLCDRCGKCCLNKLEDEKTGTIHFTSAACNLIDLKTCRCTRYAERTRLVPRCLDLKRLETEAYHWLPSTCAYRLLFEGEDLPSWHPLISGRADSVRRAGVSIVSYAVKEAQVRRLEDHVIRWLD
ncbi:MAG: YcgN family cysteine cluster protein [Gammaproteobacteria bacterium]